MIINATHNGYYATIINATCNRYRTTIINVTHNRYWATNNFVAHMHPQRLRTQNNCDLGKGDALGATNFVMIFS